MSNAAVSITFLCPGCGRYWVRHFHPGPRSATEPCPDCGEQGHPSAPPSAAVPNAPPRRYPIREKGKARK